jgi:hypothetical protein
MICLARVGEGQQMCTLHGPQGCPNCLGLGWPAIRFKKAEDRVRFLCLSFQQSRHWPVGQVEILVLPTSATDCKPEVRVAPV